MELRLEQKVKTEIDGRTAYGRVMSLEPLMVAFNDQIDFLKLTQAGKLILEDNSDDNSKEVYNYPSNVFDDWDDVPDIYVWRYIHTLGMVSYDTHKPEWKVGSTCLAYRPAENSKFITVGQVPKKYAEKFALLSLERRPGYVDAEGTAMGYVKKLIDKFTNLGQ